MKIQSRKKLVFNISRFFFLVLLNFFLSFPFLFFSLCWLCCMFKWCIYKTAFLFYFKILLTIKDALDINFLKIKKSRKFMMDLKFRKINKKRHIHLIRFSFCFSFVNLKSSSFSLNLPDLTYIQMYDLRKIY